MLMGLVMSAALGFSFGAVYVGLGVLVRRLAHRVPPRLGLHVALGGLVVRLTVALAAVAVVLTRTEVDSGAFVLSFFGVFVLNVAFDLTHLVRSGRAPVAPLRSPSAS